MIIHKFILASLESIIVVLMYLYFLKRTYYFKNRKLKIIIFVLMDAVFSWWLILSVPKGFHPIFSCIFSVIVLSNIFSVNFSISCLAFISCFIFIFLTETITIAGFSIIRGIPFIEIASNPWNNYEIGYVAKIIEIIIAILLYSCKKELIKFPVSKKEKSTTAYWLLGIVLMGMSIFNGSKKIFEIGNVFVYQSLIFLILTFFIILGAMDYKEKLEIMSLRSKFQLKEEYIDNLEAVIDIIRREKHDFSNHINTIYAMCCLNEENTVSRIKEYLKQTIYNLKNTYKFYNTGNTYIDGLIAVKSNFAFENNIILDVDFDGSLELVKVKDNDLVAIIGNIIDNAFNAVLNTNKTNKIVSIYGYSEDKKYYLSISNNGDMISKGIQNKIFEKRVSTNKNNKKNHGYGLYIVRKLVLNNNGKVSFTTAQEETEFLLEFKIV